MSESGHTSGISLTSIYSRPDRAIILWELLQERDASVNISHKAMPTYQEHVRFVESKPYEAWYFIQADRIVGSCYLSKRKEIGIQVFKEHQGKGYGSRAVKLLMKQHGSQLRYLANVNPRNSRSRAMFERLGFQHIQDTLEFPTPFKS